MNTSTPLTYVEATVSEPKRYVVEIKKLTDHIKPVIFADEGVRCWYDEEGNPVRCLGLNGLDCFYRHFETRKGPAHKVITIENGILRMYNVAGELEFVYDVNNFTSVWFQSGKPIRYKDIKHDTHFDKNGCVVSAK